MSYDFRRRQAGQRDLIDNFEARIQKVDVAAKKAAQKAAREVLSIAADQLSNFGLELDLNKSYISKFRSGSDSSMIDGTLTIIDSSGSFEEKWLKEAVFDATHVTCQRVEQHGNEWSCSFSVGG